VKRRHVKAEEPESLEQLLDQIGKAAPGEDRVALSDIVEVFGRRSFGPLLLIAGLVAISPVGDIPGVPTLMAIFVALISGQLLLGRSCFWLPKWLLNRSLPRGTLQTSLRWLRPPAGFVDRLLRRRMTIFTDGLAVIAIALACVVVALCMPPLEFVPFTGTVAGLALCGFGSALTAHDGLVALVTLVFTSAAFGVAAIQLL
jgi:hypothetical protein